MWKLSSALSLNPITHHQKRDPSPRMTDAPPECLSNVNNAVKPAGMCHWSETIKPAGASSNDWPGDDRRPFGWPRPVTESVAQ